MAEDKKARKSSRHFNIEKTVERHFDIEKDEAPVVTQDNNALTTSKKEQKPLPVGLTQKTKSENVATRSETTANKVTANQTPVNQSPMRGNSAGEHDFPNEGSPKSGKTKWFAAALVGLLAVGGGAYYLSQQGDDEGTMTEQVDSQRPDGVAQDDLAGAGQNGQNPEDAPLQDAALADAGGENVSGESESGENNPDDAIVPSGNENAPINGQSGNGSGSQAGTATVSNPQAGTATASNSETGSATSSEVASISAPQVTNPASNNNPTAVGGSGRATSPAVPTRIATGTVEQEANAVIRGNYGNGEERKRILGDRYAEIQSKVNEMYWNGLVY